MIADFLRMFVEFLRASFSMVLVFVVLGGLALTVLAVELETGADGRLVAHVDVVYAAAGLAIALVAGYVIPKWFGGWAKPTYPDEPSQDDDPKPQAGDGPAGGRPGQGPQG